MYQGLIFSVGSLVLALWLFGPPWASAQQAPPQLTTEERLAQCLGEIGSMGRSYSASQQATQMAAGEMAVQLQRTQTQLQKTQADLDAERAKNKAAEAAPKTEREGS